MITAIRSFAALVLLTVTFSVSAVSWHDDSHYVPLGPRTGYYIVRPGSALSRQLGVDAAPTADTADPFRQGYGADALAFRFDRNGVLSAPPAYIVQAIPNEFYTRRLGSFIRGKSRLQDAKAFFGQPQRIERRTDGFTAYYAIQVYNPFESRGGGRR
jgi:hypothetical protein